MSGYTIAVDAGTTYIKAVVLTSSGREVATAVTPTSVLHPTPERAEQDMNEVRAAVLDCIARGAAEAGGAIDRITITAQGDGAWTIDRHGDPVAAAVLWNDGRATDVIADWTADGVLERAFRVNGSLSNLGLPNSVLAWYRRHEPERLRDARTVLSCGGWLYFTLTGMVGLHPSDASAPWLDVAAGEISDELLSIYGLSWARDLIPPVLSPDDCTAPLTADLAARLGLPAGTPVTIAPYDVVSTAVGSGVATIGDAFCILGTTLCTGVLQMHPDTRGVPSGLTLLGEPGAPVVRAFPTLAGTGVVDWAVDLLGLTRPGELTELASQSPPGAHGVRVWPYLSPAGERAPFLDPAARGVIGGITLSHGRADIARAVIEGLAHVIRDCLDATGVHPTSIALSGGGANSALWCSTIADVTGVPTLRGDASQVGARGALIAALTAAGAESDVRIVRETMQRSTTLIEPDPGAAELADDRHHDFLATRAVLAERWSGWQASR